MSAARTKSTSLKAAMITGAAFAALMTGQAFAQDAAASGDAAQVEAVTVTGSSIRGVAPVGSALIGVTRDQIQATAPSNVKDLLSTVPALGNFGTNAEQSTPNRFRTTGLLPNIHNLGIYATLTLLNGHRVALTGTEGTYPDPSAVPTIAIQRTEIIADGTSAIYGSDATAGVINFIYRKPFNGVETSATYSFDDDTRYMKQNFGIIGGHTWDAFGGGGVMLAYEYSMNHSPLNTEIPYLALGSDQRSRGGRDLRGTTCLTPTFRQVNVANSAATGPTYGSAATGYSTNAVDQRCGIILPSAVIGDGKRNAVLLTANQQLTDSVKIWTEFNYSHYVGYSPVGGRPAINSVPIYRGSPLFTAANIPPALFNNPAVGAVAITLSGNALLPALGRKVSQTGTVYTWVSGLDIDLGKEWQGHLSLDISRTRDYNGTPGSELDTLNLIHLLNGAAAPGGYALRPGETYFNPFGNQSTNSAVDNALIDNGSGQLNWGQQGLQVLEFKADGPLFELPGGTMRAAVGASFTASQANELQLGGSRSPTAGYNGVVRNDHPRQQNEAAFFELNAPLVSSKNAMPGIAELTLSVSGRYDNYDKYGGKFNPKYGVSWSPIEDLKLHASYGKNFNAPNVGLLTGLFGQPNYNANPNLVIGYGPYAGTLLTNINQYTLSGQGGGNLTPERAKTYSVGGNYTPKFLPGLNVGLNWYKVNYSNLFFKVTGSDLITNGQFASLAEFFPSLDRIKVIEALYPPSSPITVANFEYVAHTEAVNLGRRIYEGLDYDISYRMTTDNMGSFQAQFTANQQLKLDEQVLPGQAKKSRIKTCDNSNGCAVQWKTRTALGWNYEGLTANVFYNYFGSYINTTITPNQKVKPFKTVDATLAYEFKDVGISYLKGVTLQGRVTNLFDTDPPFFDNAGGYNGAGASPFGRTYDLTVRAKF